MHNEANLSTTTSIRNLLAWIGIAAFWAAAVLSPPLTYGSHRLGSLISPAPLEIGPDSGEDPTGANTWEVSINDADPVTKYLILHFTGSTLSGGDRLEVDLGYDTDVFTEASGPEFWSRPIGGDTATVRYIDDGVGAAEGSVTFDMYGRGEEIDVFLLSSPFVDPATFTCQGVCPPGDDPSWENVACLAPGTMKDTADSVGMIVFEKPGNQCVAGETTCLTSCSASLIDADRILTAGHCISDDARAASASFTLDFQTDCDGDRPIGYDPRFFKVTRVVKTGYARAVGDVRTQVDYSILQIDPGGGVGVPPVPIRADAPSLGDELFVVHHPRGATKKVSHQPDDPTCSVNEPPSITLSYACDSDNGSSGSPVFDDMGRIVAVNDWAVGHCSDLDTSCNSGQAATAILSDFLTEPPPPRDVKVMEVFDRSGSMNLAGLTGVPKIDEARRAAALFIDLLATDASHRAGLVSFGTTASDPVDFPLAPVTDDNKDTLIGPAPDRDAGIVGDVDPGGTTSIGDGLDAAQTELDGGPGNLTPAILLMTDGLQNTAPFIETVEPSLGDTRLCALGFGSEASLDGPLLARVARDHGGIYTRAGEGLELKKFFVLCFGNIFHNGISMDPFHTLPAGDTLSAPIPLNVCGEQTLTVVLGWEHPEVDLQIRLTTPDGAIVTRATPGLVASSGDTWAYLRMSLPFNGERDGTWQVQAVRSAGFHFEERFFVTSVIDGGPTFRVATEFNRTTRRPLYTGDPVNPLVVLREPSGGIVPASVMVEVERPLQGTGNILAGVGPRAPLVIGGDALDARTSTLVSLEAERGAPLIPTGTDSFPLFDDADHEDGAIEADGIFGNPLAGIALFEGNYAFHARATFGGVCPTSRELFWSEYVSIGIDVSTTDVMSQTLGPTTGGRLLVRVRFTPRDRFGSYLGPGRLNAFQVEARAGSVLVGAVSDAGFGSYAQVVEWDPASGFPPGVTITQPERPPVVIGSTPISCSPQAQGYWHRQCLGSGEIRPGRNGRGPSAPTEPGFVADLEPCADAKLEDLGFYGTTTCGGMDAVPPSDPCERALKQLTALVLNVCSGRLFETCEVDVSAHACSSTNVRDLMEEIAVLIQNGHCASANDCAAAVNESGTGSLSVLPKAGVKKEATHTGK